tara:strand:- start:16756 stop:17367 length:612 start_codon:yes stop_codon:yes gene_type:complete
MGWFSDALFGKRKRLDQSKLDDYMAPTRQLVEQQKDIAQQMLDPNSQMQQEQRALMNQQYSDQVAQQNQDLQATAAMRGVSPGQIAQMQRASMNQSRGQFASSMKDLAMQQQSGGLNLLGQMTGWQEKMDSNRANAYVQQINAHNQRRAGNMSMAGSLLGGVIGGMDFNKLFGGGEQVQDDVQNYITGASAPPLEFPDYGAGG